MATPTQATFVFTDGDRHTVTYQNGGAENLTIEVMDQGDRIAVVTTDSVPVTLASFLRSSLKFWFTDLPTITNV